MEIHEPSKADWKLFRERVPEGQEKYIARLCDEYSAILTGKDRRYEAFWTIEKRIQEDKKRPDVMAQRSVSTQMINLDKRRIRHENDFPLVRQQKRPDPPEIHKSSDTGSGYRAVLPRR